MSISRRRFFTQTGLMAATSVAAPQIVRPAEAGNARPGQTPRRIIHMVADGMSAGTLTLADHLSQLIRPRGLTWMRLHQNPGAVAAYMNMRSLNSLVTDSSAASSSWGSGSRIENGTVNVLPDGRALKTLYELFGEQGWKRALVTTTEITHATPAGFAASGLRRESAEPIAAQYLDRKIELLLGGGRKFFDPSFRKDKRDLVAEYRARGFVIAQTADELKAAPTDKSWLGIFAPSHLPFTLDQAADEKARTTVPTLAAMTRRALEKLEREERFIMQVEGGRVDHACHTCDAAGALHDQIAFDEAIDVCLEFQQKHPDTLIVITTDHGNGNPGLNGAGANYMASSLLFANLKQVKASFAVILSRLRVSATLEKDDDGAREKPRPVTEPKEIQQILRELTGYEMSEKKALALVPFLEKKGDPIYGLMNNVPAQLGQMLANHIGIGWTANVHTADYVPLLALGPGAERFRGFIQNTDVFRHYTAMAGIDFRNPEVPLIAKAREHQVENVAEYWRASEVA